jgi:hypothetical protein
MIRMTRERVNAMAGQTSTITPAMKTYGPMTAASSARWISGSSAGAMAARCSAVAWFSSDRMNVLPTARP